MIVLYSNLHHILTADEHSPYRQQADFLYYTHIQVPDCRAVIIEDKKHIFLPDRDEKKILWEWSSITVDEVLSQNPNAHIYYMSEWQNVIQWLYSSWQIITNLDYLNYDTDDEKSQLKDLLQVTDDDLVPLDHDYRAIKTIDEIKKIHQAQQLTLAAIDYATRDIKAWMWEYEIAAKLSYYYESHGYTHAFHPIVASGPNACTLHYAANNAQIQIGDILLIDTGAYRDGYCGDCSRSIIVVESESEQVTENFYNQKLLLDIVKQVHDDCIVYIRPGLTMRQVHDYAVMQFQRYFSQYDLVRKDDYFPHSIWHSIGLDVHDPLQKNRPLEVGMCVTIEPWLYIPVQNIGIRWEDIVVLVKNGCEMLV